MTVRATPKGGRDAIDGIVRLADASTALKIRVRAAPADGEANEAIGRLLARQAGIPPSAVTLLQGASGRIKIFQLTGNPAALAASLSEAFSRKEAKTK